MADALWYAQEKCNATAVVDIATLTGACMVALGNQVTSTSPCHAHQRTLNVFTTILNLSLLGESWLALSIIRLLMLNDHAVNTEHLQQWTCVLFKLAIC